MSERVPDSLEWRGGSVVCRPGSPDYLSPFEHHEFQVQIAPDGVPVVNMDDDRARHSRSVPVDEFAEPSSRAAIRLAADHILYTRNGPLKPRPKGNHWLDSPAVQLDPSSTRHKEGFEVESIARRGDDKKQVRLLMEPRKIKQDYHKYYVAVRLKYSEESFYIELSPEELGLTERPETITGLEGRPPDSNSSPLPTIRFTEDAYDGAAAEQTDVESGAVGVKQRLRIHVPVVYTQLTLGEAYRNQDAQGFAYPGFGVETDGHIFLNARNVAARSTVTIQAKDDVVVQSERGKLWAGASGDTNIASQSNSFLMGGGGVVIAGGAAVTWGGNQNADGTTPPRPSWMGGFAQAGSGINRVWAAADSLVAVATGIRGVVAAKTGKPKGLNLGLATANLLMGNAGGAIVSGLGAANSDPIGGTVIHGTGGVIVGSTHTMGLYSATGTTIASGLGAGILAPSVGITGFNDVALESLRKAEVKSGGATDVIGHDELLLACRTGPTKLLGRNIEIGVQAGVAPQWSTEKVRVESDHVIVSTGGEVTGGHWYSSDPMGVQVLSKTWIYTDSKRLVGRHEEQVHLAVKDKFGLSIHSDKLSIGNIDGRMKPVGDGAGITITEPEIKLEKKDSSVRVSDRGVLLRKGGTQLTVKRDGAKINGGTIKIG